MSITDEDITTTKLSTGPADADGTDGDATDTTDGDGDGTDGGDADCTDGGDADGTDS